MVTGHTKESWGFVRSFETKLWTRYGATFFSSFASFCVEAFTWYA